MMELLPLSGEFGSILGEEAPVRLARLEDRDDPGVTWLDKEADAKE